MYLYYFIKIWKFTLRNSFEAKGAMHHIADKIIFEIEIFYNQLIGNDYEKLKYVY